MLRRLGIAAICATIAGCTFNDPTESTFSAGFRNDLGYAVKLGMCSSYTCQGKLYYTDYVKRGATIHENISSDGVVQPFRIESTPRDQVVGCLQVYAKRYVPHLVIALSRLTRCPGRKIRVA
ncbi:MAG: hypothetical protein QOF50_1068 [Gaiellaceae bacterium]|jgi:hypothetical protein|nr:hypothetical protein [Gaiellaceae bacterium]